MNPDQSKDLVNAFRQLQKATLPDNETIEKMLEPELDEFMADTGTDMKGLNERIAAAKKKFAGRYALMRARMARRAGAAPKPCSVPVPSTREEIIAYFSEHYRHELPMAARNFKSATYEELRQMFIDLHS